MQRLERLQVEHPEYWGTEHRRPITLSTLETITCEASDQRFILFMPERLFGNWKAKDEGDNNNNNCSVEESDLPENCEDGNADDEDTDDDSTSSSEMESALEDGEEPCRLKPQKTTLDFSLNCPDVCIFFSMSKEA